MTPDDPGLQLGRDDLAVPAVVGACCAGRGAPSGGCVSEGRNESSGRRREWPIRESRIRLVCVGRTAARIGRPSGLGTAWLISPRVSADGGGPADGAGALLPDGGCRVLVVVVPDWRLFQDCSFAEDVGANPQPDLVRVPTDEAATPDAPGSPIHRAVELLSGYRARAVTDAGGAAFAHVDVPLADACAVAGAGGGQRANLSMPPRRWSLNRGTALPDASRGRHGAPHRFLGGTHSPGPVFRNDP